MAAKPRSPFSSPNECAFRRSTLADLPGKLCFCINLIAMDFVKHATCACLGWTTKESRVRVWDCCCTVLTMCVCMCVCLFVFCHFLPPIYYHSFLSQYIIIPFLVFPQEGTTQLLNMIPPEVVYVVSWGGNIAVIKQPPDAGSPHSEKHVSFKVPEKTMDMSP